MTTLQVEAPEPAVHERPRAEEAGGEPLRRLLVLWIAAAAFFRLITLSMESRIVGTISPPGFLAGVLVGLAQDLLVAFELVLLVVLVRRVLRAVPGVGVGVACAVFFLFHAYLLFDFLLYRGIGMRMDASFFAFLGEAAPFADSAWDAGLSRFLLGLALLAGVTLWISFYFRRVLPAVRVTGRSALVMAATCVAAVLGTTCVSPDVTYCANNAVFDLQYSIARRTIGADRLAPLGQMTRESVEQVAPFSQGETVEYVDPEYPLLKETRGFTGPVQFHVPIAPGERPHVVLLFMESFRAADVGVLGGRYDASPCFDRLAREGVLFTNCYACGVQTTRGVIASLFGIPPRFSRQAVQSGLPDLPLIGIADLFRRRGYRTGYFFNGSLDFEGKRAFFPRHGYDEVHGREHLAKRLPEAHGGSWGLDDEYLMPYVVEWLRRRDEAGVPTLVTMFTITHHHPWKVPPDFDAPVFDVDDPEYAAFLQSFYYSDHCLGRFVDLLRRAGLAEKTVLFILADTSTPMGEHYDNHMLVHHSFEENLRIPLLIVAPGRLRQGLVIDDVCSQLDLLPTVMDVFGLTGRNHAIGSSLVRRVPERVAYFNNPFVRRSLGLRHEDFKHVSKVDVGTSALYDLASDPREEHDVADRDPERAARYRGQVLALARFMEELYRHRRIAPPAGSHARAETDE